MNFPRSFSIAAKQTDYRLFARDMAFECRVQYRMNAEIEGPNGRTLLSGWAPSASQKVTFFVSNPDGEKAGVEAVHAAAHELARTLSLFAECEDYLRPLMTGFPLGCRLMGAPKRVERKRDRRASYIGDFTASLTDAWNMKRKSLIEFLVKEAA